MAKVKVEVNKAAIQSKKDLKKVEKPIKEKVNKKSFSDDVDIEDDTDVEEEQSSTRGRKAGFTVETPIALIYITDEYRIDIKDGRNKILQKLVTKKRDSDGKDATEPWKEGDIYTKWENTIGCFPSTYKGAFDTIHELMVEDGVKARERVSVEEFLKLYKEKNDWLEKLYKTMFNEEDELIDKKKVKGV